jgi:hypothetical protein
MTVQICALEIVQDKACLRLDCRSAIKMDDVFVVPPYQRDTSKFQDMRINLLKPTGHVMHQQV